MKTLHSSPEFDKAVLIHTSAQQCQSEFCVGSSMLLSRGNLMRCGKMKKIRNKL